MESEDAKGNVRLLKLLPPDRTIWPWTHLFLLFISQGSRSILYLAPAGRTAPIASLGRVIAQGRLSCKQEGSCVLRMNFFLSWPEQPSGQNSLEKSRWAWISGVAEVNDNMQNVQIIWTQSNVQKIVTVLSGSGKNFGVLLSAFTRPFWHDLCLEAQTAVIFWNVNT